VLKTLVEDLKENEVYVGFVSHLLTPDPLPHRTFPYVTNTQLGMVQRKQWIALTVLCCSNMTETEELKLLVIWKIVRGLFWAVHQCLTMVTKMPTYVAQSGQIISLEFKKIY
jgi:hypothetical protein